MIFSIRYVYMGTLKNRHQSLVIESSVEFIEKNYRTDEIIQWFKGLLCESDIDIINFNSRHLYIAVHEYFMAVCG